MSLWGWPTRSATRKCYIRVNESPADKRVSRVLGETVTVPLCVFGIANGRKYQSKTSREGAVVETIM